jgi:hypothetical protein
MKSSDVLRPRSASTRAPDPLEREADHVANQFTPDRLGDTAGGRLCAPLRNYFEPRLRHDFGHVRLHDDTAANDSARALGARAYTFGSDIFFGRGERSLRLLAHELTHVVQQRSSAPVVQCAPAPDAHTPQGSCDRFIMEHTDAELYAIFSKVTPDLRYKFADQATGAFKERIMALYAKYQFPSYREGVTTVEHVRSKPPAHPRALPSAHASATASTSDKDGKDKDAEAPFMAWMLAPGMVKPPQPLREVPEGLKQQYGYEYQEQIVEAGLNVTQKIVEYGAMAADIQMSVGTAGISPARTVIGSMAEPGMRTAADMTLSGGKHVTDMVVARNVGQLLQNLGLDTGAVTVLENGKGALVYEARTGVLRVVGHGVVDKTGSAVHAGYNAAEMANIIRKFPQPVKAVELQGCNLSATTFPDLLAKDVGIAVKSYASKIENIAPQAGKVMRGLVNVRDLPFTDTVEAAARWSHP